MRQPQDHVTGSSVISSAARSAPNLPTQEMERDFDKDQPSAGGGRNLTGSGSAHEIAVALLTGGGDKPYVFGLATELMSKGAAVDLIGSDELDCPEFQAKPGVNFLN